MRSKLGGVAVVLGILGAAAIAAAAVSPIPPDRYPFECRHANGVALQGDDADDRIVGTADSDILRGGGGEDSIAARGGLDDCVYGQDGSDRLWGGAGFDLLRGGSGDDHLNEGQSTKTGDTYAGVMHGGSGDDVLKGGPEDNIITKGNHGNDMIFLGAGDDRAKGDGGSDVLSGGSGEDRLAGLAGNDVIAGGPGNDKLMGSIGNDTLKPGRDDPAVARPGTAGSRALHRNLVLCGEGHDVVISRSPRDRIVASCEIVRRRPARG